MTAPLKWRSQLCPCGYCPDGTRIEWRYTLDIRFRPRSRRWERTETMTTSPDGLIGDRVTTVRLRARTRNVRKALEGPEAGK